MTEPNKYRAYFTLVGDFDPDVISKRLNLRPTYAWKKGDRNERTHLERKFSRWSLDSRLGPDATLESQVEDVLEQLRPFAKEVAEIRRELNGVMQLVGQFYTYYPGLSFEASTLAELGSLNLGMDFDFYYLYSDKREDS